MSKGPESQEFIDCLSEQAPNLSYKIEENRSPELILQLILAGVETGAFRAIWSAVRNWCGDKRDRSVVVTYTSDASTEGTVRVEYCHLTDADVRSIIDQYIVSSNHPVRIDVFVKGNANRN